VGEIDEKSELFGINSNFPLNFDFNVNIFNSILNLWLNALEKIKLTPLL